MYPYAVQKLPTIQDDRLALSPALAQLAAELDGLPLPETDHAPDLTGGQPAGKKRSARKEREAAH